MLFVDWLLRKFLDENILNTQSIEIWPGTQSSFVVTNISLKRCSL